MEKEKQNFYLKTLRSHKKYQTTKLINNSIHEADYMKIIFETQKNGLIKPISIPSQIGTLNFMPNNNLVVHYEMNTKLQRFINLFNSQLSLTTKWLLPALHKSYSYTQITSSNNNNW